MLLVPLLNHIKVATPVGGRPLGHTLPRTGSSRCSTYEYLELNAEFESGYRDSFGFVMGWNGHSGRTHDHRAGTVITATFSI